MRVKADPELETTPVRVEFSVESAENLQTEQIQLLQGGFDVNGDGKVDAWESNLCRYCLFAAIILAFGEKFVGLI